jgi:hypothetical protein
VLRPAVQEQQRRTVAGLGDVHTDIAEVDVAVGDTGDMRQRRAHRPAWRHSSRPAASGAAASASDSGRQQPPTVTEDPRRVRVV